MRQVRTGGGTDLLQSYANYANHLPGTVTDAAGKTTSMTYDARGQALSVTNAKNETTTHPYDAHDRLTLVTGPIAGATPATPMMTIIGSRRPRPTGSR